MKHYLIIGGTSGIGNEIVKVLNSQQNKVSVIARDKNNISSTIEFYSKDVTDDNQAWPELDSIDGLVYCPGTINLKPFQALNKEDYLHDFTINFLGAVSAIKKYLPILTKSKGSIVLFSTVAVQTGIPYHASISSAKGAIEGITKALAAELTPNVRVNAIAPSLTDTPLAKPFLSTKEKKIAGQKRNPMNKIGTPEEIASVASFLLSEDASWITGQIIHVDGGMGSLRLL